MSVENTAVVMMIVRALSFIRDQSNALLILSLLLLEKSRIIKSSAANYVSLLDYSHSFILLIFEGSGYFLLASVLDQNYVLTAGANEGDVVRLEYYGEGVESHLWRFKNSQMINKGGLVLEFLGSESGEPKMPKGPGNFVMSTQSHRSSQLFNIDGKIFKSVNHGWAIDIPKAKIIPGGMDMYLYPMHGKANQQWIVKKILVNKTGKMIFHK